MLIFFDPAVHKVHIDTNLHINNNPSSVFMMKMNSPPGPGPGGDIMCGRDGAAGGGGMST